MPHADARTAAPAGPSTERAGRRRADTAGSSAVAPRSAIDRASPWAIAVLATVLLGLMSTRTWVNMVATSWDTAIFAELAKAYASFSAPIVPIKGDDFNLLGDHFHPILVLLAPVWWVWPSGLALLWTQAALFAASAVPLTRLAIERLGTGWGIAAGLGYALGFGMQAAQDVGFHEIAFGVPLMALSLTALLRGRDRAAILWAAPLVFVKEDLGLTVLALAAVIWWTRPAARRWAAGLAAWAAVWFVLATFVILPALNPLGGYDYTGNIGSIWQVFVPLDKWITVLMLALTAGLLGLRSPLILVMLPTLAWRFTGNVEFYWTWYWHYNAILMPIALAALLDVAPRVRWWHRRVAVAASVAVTLVLAGAMPLASLLRPSTWDTTWRAAPAERAIAAVPAGASVGTDITLMARLVPDHDVQWIHGPNARVPRCVVVDDWAFSWNGEPPADAGAWADEHYKVAAGTFRPAVDDGGFRVVCRAGG